MTSNSISLSNRIAGLWNALDSAWRWALGVYFVARVLYSLWALVVLALTPVVVQNLDLFGDPVVAYFDVASGERFVYARMVGARVLTFRRGDAGTLVDVQTESVWSLREGRAQSGALAGTPLAQAAYTVEDVFPYRGVTAELNPLLGMWQRFDTNWYLKIAQRGYAADDGSTVYLPLYPLLIRALGTILLGNDLLAALVISNLALILALYLLYRLTREWADAGTARRTIIYLMLFPTAFYFFAGYTESLFLALTLAAFYFARKNGWAWAGMFGMLTTWTRLQGVLLVIPLAYMVWAQIADYKWRWNVQVLRALLPLVLMPLALMGFLVFNNLTLLSSYEGALHARFVIPWENVGVALAVVAQGLASQPDVLNLAVTLLFGAMCVPVWRRLPREFALYTVLMFLAPLFRMTTTQPLVSMARYVAVLFPVFLVWGMWGKNRWVERALVYPSVALSLYLSAQFWLWGWVA